MNENTNQEGSIEFEQITNSLAGDIWSEYFPRLASLARRKLGAMPRRVSDEEDIALSALKSFFVGAEAGRFDIQGHDDLWRLLMTITVRKVTAHRRRFFAEKRGGGKVQGESVFLNKSGNTDEFNLAQVLDENNLPEMADEVVRVCEDLLSTLNDDKLRRTALLRMEGYNNQEISDKLKCSVARTKQRLSRIREKWSCIEH